MTQVAMVRGAFALLGAALLILGIHTAAVRGLADAYYTHARLVLSTSAQAKRPPEPGELDDARASLREALSFEPSNPLFVEHLARTDEMKAAFSLSLAGWRESARMRPGSPYAWASIALLKLRMGEMDAEFYGALERAARLGPWEEPVQLLIADVGLAAWRRLAPPAKAQVVGALERGLLRQEPEIRRIATAQGTLPLVCAGAPLPPRLAAFCVKI